MPKELESGAKTNSITNHECENPIFDSRDEMRKSLTRLCYGNLYVIGSIWVGALRSVLTGSKMCLVPTVKAAAKKDAVPNKPPKMRYKDLPVYERPHHDYKNYLCDKEKCADYKVKLMHQSLYPSVSYYRKAFQEMFCEIGTFLKEGVFEMVEDIDQKKKEIKVYIRDPNKLCYRQVAVALGTAVGFYLGSRKKGYLYRRLFFASVGALTMGWLCFPKETDKTFRDVCYEAGTILATLYNFICFKNAKMPPYGPCEKDKPKKDPNKPKVKTPCPVKK